MAGGSLFLLLDDIASVLDDVATMTKVATKKTAGVLGDDLALNAQQVTGVRADREIAVVWAVAKGSLLNKAILVPAALAISVFAPWLIAPLLMLGGAFLCFEGFEKLAHKFLHGKEEAGHRSEVVRALAAPEVDLVALEKDKIKGAVRTDFILSAEIIVIALGVVGGMPFGTQVAVLISIAVMMTIGVYGLVAGIVKLDDAGLLLSRLGNAVARSVGAAILWLAPWLLRALSVLGTAAMFLVGGGILSHGLPPVHHLIETLTAGMTGMTGALLPTLLDGVVGMVVGALVLVVVGLGKRLLPRRAATH
jgi:predicted DNA repair protein MutK